MVLLRLASDLRNGDHPEIRAKPQGTSTGRAIRTSDGIRLIAATLSLGYRYTRSDSIRCRANQRHINSAGAKDAKKVNPKKKNKLKRTNLYADLQSFLKAHDNTVTRERLLFHRFGFDLYLAAARRMYPLAVLSIEVDREGFDVMLDDGDRERRIQLKAVDAKTSSWETTKRFLRPEGFFAERLGFQTTMEGVGVGGAIVVMQYDPGAPDLNLRYLFCDAHILAAMAQGWVPNKVQGGRGRKAGSRATAQNFIEQLNLGVGAEEIKIPKGLFVEARGPEHLLAPLEMHSVEDHQWCSMLRLRLGREYKRDIHGPVEREIQAALKQLIVT